MVQWLQAQEAARKELEAAAQKAAALELSLMRRQLSSAQGALVTAEKVALYPTWMDASIQLIFVPYSSAALHTGYACHRRHHHVKCAVQNVACR